MTAWINKLVLPPLLLAGAAACAEPVGNALAASASFCARVATLAARGCRAKYACTAPALAELRAAQCGCQADARLAPTVDARLNALLQATPAYACCSGVALARTPALCG